jgi:hypothetical protein
MLPQQKAESMPKNVAQWTGLAVTAIIVFGRDSDVIYAVPFGLLAGVLASLLVAFDDQRRAFATVSGAPSSSLRG